MLNANPAWMDVIERLRAAPRLLLLLDYDGTLVPIAPTPERALPDDELRSLLTGLASRPASEVHIVSGRPRDVLEAWFSELPIGLWAEHGTFYRPPSRGPWESTVPIPMKWMARVEPILEEFTADTPGSFVERKTASLAWHYRAAAEESGERRAHELRTFLVDALRDEPLEVIEGKKVLEVRLRGVSKAVVAARLVPDADSAASILAFGDDRTDEDLFEALPESSVRVAVGARRPHASCRVADYRDVRALLRRLV
jgi:trehalose 6-phosphate synthase/phosphatase